MATSLGILVPILKDAEHTDTVFGQLVMAAGSLAELGPLGLLSVFLLGLVGKPGGGAGAAGRLHRRRGGGPAHPGLGPLRRAVQRLENSSPQLRVRLAITFSLAFAVVAEHFGLATVLGAFLAGSSCAGPVRRRPLTRCSRASWKRSASAS